MNPATIQLTCEKPTHVVIWTENEPQPESILGKLMQRITELENRFNALSSPTLTVNLAMPGAPMPGAQAPLPAPVAPAAPPAPAPAAPPAPAPAPAPAPFGTPAPGLYFPPALSPHLTGMKVEEVQLEEELPEEAEAEAEAEEEAEPEEPEDEGEEEEEAGQTLVDFEWKGVTYYKDSENQVYEKDDDGDLNDTPIGIWNEAKQKLQRYAK